MEADGFQPKVNILATEIVRPSEMFGIVPRLLSMDWGCRIQSMIRRTLKAELAYPTFI